MTSLAIKTYTVVLALICGGALVWSIDQQKAAAAAPPKPGRGSMSSQPPSPTTARPRRPTTCWSSATTRWHTRRRRRRPSCCTLSAPPGRPAGRPHRSPLCTGPFPVGRSTRPHRDVDLPPPSPATTAATPAPVTTTRRRGRADGSAAEMIAACLEMAGDGHHMAHPPPAAASVRAAARTLAAAVESSSTRHGGRAFGRRARSRGSTESAGSAVTVDRRDVPAAQRMPAVDRSHRGVFQPLVGARSRHGAMPGSVLTRTRHRPGALPDGTGGG